uniref:Uncharacterized protein n=1 Tax=Arundo donax TaxID=35708 RepID=A0A0A9AXW2_ARUDO
MRRGIFKRQENNTCTEGQQGLLVERRICTGNKKHTSKCNDKANTCSTNL